jgi:hypothetical protein
VAVAASVAGVALAGDPSPTDDAARRAAIAKLGRLAWAAPAKSVAFCDLDGSNTVESTSRHPTWLRWLPDGKRVVAAGQDRVFIVDSTTGATADLTADAKYGERFLSEQPLLSPDGRRLVTWRSTRSNRKSIWGTVSNEVAGYALFDLDAGTRTDLGPAPAPASWWDPTPAAWSADGKSLYAVMGDVQNLTRFAPDGTHPVVVASVAPGRRITAVAVDGPQPMIAIQDGAQFEVRGVDAKTIFSLPRAEHGVHPMSCRGLAWESGGATLLVDTIGDDDAWYLARRRIGAGRPPENLVDPYLPRRATIAGATWSVEERRVDGGGSSLFRVATPPDECIKIGPGCWPRAVGNVVVFWRSPWNTGGSVLWDATGRPPGECELCAYDPKDGATIRLAEREFEVQCWDVLVTPPASRGR